ncbi:single-stranded-DNA-specific exonuclease RecJ [Aquibacillus halophilus]|uniref:Single-stranded-DNA-specific exonuclease RecJ n=1 Tax=Aquibacillus halophilus TaxID=930132 RepID=A0A6A8DBB7_9BACI|nr:single-stranded-DNA-specific exonuclease RecJ [Aquibacillus halophilus]MRH43013.1 single-stranded-DNA-specific exonuclease RecJ [Aquibacillus halophilus]
MIPSKAKWKFTYSNDDLPHFDHQLSISSLTERLLVQRGISTNEEAQRFLTPELTHLLNPMLLKDMDKAVARVKQAIVKGESILVFGDYDADGVSSTTLMVEALQELGAICDYYIPNRFTEGYGPNEDAFKAAHKQGYTVIITVDTGIAAVHEAEVAKQLGIDLIITDHHEEQEVLPNAFAIIHPKCSPEYSFKELAGVGVAFKFAQALLGYFPNQFLDLVVIGTIADLVPLVNENRVLAHFGLKAITSTKRPGLVALKNNCNIEGAVTEENIGFLIGPRINAVGRLQDANAAVDLLLTKDMVQADELAQFIDQLNQERQKIVTEISKEAEELVEADSTGMNEKVIIVAKEGWNEGVLGIVASKLVRIYDRPAIVLSINKEKKTAKGSARSIAAFDLFSNCMQIRKDFINFGGHAQAAGMTLAEENISVIRKKLNQLASEQLSADDFKQLLTIDHTVEIKDLDVSLIVELNKLAPFGMGNPKPLFHVRAVPTELRQIGNQKNHLKMSIEQAEAKLDSIGFGMGDMYSKISPNAEMDLIGELEINEWNGKRKVQLLLKDLAITEWQLFDYRGSKHWRKQLIPLLGEQSAAVTFQTIDGTGSLPPEINHVQIDENWEVDYELTMVEDLILLDLPNSLEQLAQVIKAINPSRIYACYLVHEGHYFNSIPNREDFKWFYAMLLKHKEFNISVDTPKLSKHKSWKPEKIRFITQVFFELEFVKIENGILKPHSQPSKKDLTEAPIYQQKLNQLEIETTLYYSNYKELKKWFTSEMNEVVSPKEEVTHGL